MTFKTKFLEIAVGFMVREGYSEGFAAQEAMRFFETNGGMMAKANAAHPYVKADRTGAYGTMSRKEKVSLVTLFQNAVEHATYEIEEV